MVEAFVRAEILYGVSQPYNEEKSSYPMFNPSKPLLAFNTSVNVYNSQSVLKVRTSNNQPRYQ